jgi:hypothetical protein
LKIISKIPENVKLSKNIDGDISLEGNFFYTPIKRLLFGDSRDKSISYINEYIEEAIEFSKNIIENSVFINNINHIDITNYYDNTSDFIKKFNTLKNINSELKNCISGLINIKNNYHNDTTVSSKIDIIINKIHNFNQIIEHKYILDKN